MWINNSKDNELIAKFMGAKYVDEHLIEFENFYSFNEINEGEFVYTNWFDPENELQYHTSSDWLDPVVQKIEKYLWDNQGKIGYFDECLQSNDHEVRYQAVVEFIKHINQ